MSIFTSPPASKAPRYHTPAMLAYRNKFRRAGVGRPKGSGFGNGNADTGALRETQTIDINDLRGIEEGFRMLQDDDPRDVRQGAA